MARAKPDGYTLFVGNVSTNAITPVLFKKKFKINFENDVVSVTRLAIYPSFLITTTANFDVKNVKELVGSRQEEPRQGALHQRRRRLLPALRHGDVRAARRRRHGPHPEQDRRRRHDQRSGGRRRAGRVAQRGELGGDDQGRQAAADRGARRAAAEGLSGRADPGRGRLSRTSARCTGRACWRRRRRRSRCWRRCSRRSRRRRRSRRCRRRSASSSSACKPSESLDEAQTWLKNELDTWRKITAEVKIDLTD